MIRPPAIAALAILLAAVPAAAVELPLPANAVLAAERVEPLGSHTIPVSAWADGEVQVIATEGTVARQAWRIPSSALTTLQLVDPLRGALEEAGYRILFECAADACGGFDFRYGLALLPEPDMHVDLGDFRYLAAEAPGDPPGERISIVASRSAGTGYVHLTRIGPASEAALALATGPTTAPPAVADDPEPDAGTIASALARHGRAVLDGLDFARGSDRLTGADAPALAELAAYLRTNPEARVVLVGHTDAEGSLEANRALSERRAGAVLEALVTGFGIARDRLRAEGVGYLVPRASNLTEEGRAANRRVEAVKVETE